MTMLGKAIVTGGAGFIGSHLTDALLAAGTEVHIIDDLSSGDWLRASPRARLHQLDVCGPEACRTAAAIKPDVIYHLAAQADVQRSIQNPGLDLSVNVQGTINMLEACRLASGCKLVFASTSAVYGDLAKNILTEDDPARPISFYGLSKLTAEHYIRLYARLFGVPYTILRYGNVFGPRQTAKGEGGVVAVFMDRVAAGEPLGVNGDGEQTRDFIYVADIVQANLAAASRGDGETLHASTGHPTSVNTLIRLLEELHPAGVSAQYRPAKAGDIRHSCLSTNHAAACLGWSPAYSFAEGIEETYRARMNARRR
ncbi:NAD-dependent epimerase/dehydratase family protein [Paenibacillus sambharensis]|nr:NAD-dependent epimerase/dehydratase family protein [Paenibacillus sambharensis]